MANHSDRTGHRLSINTSSSSSRYRQRYDQSPEPTFSPTGLLGNRYDERRKEMEARSQEAKQAHESPFTGGLLQSLTEFEEQRLIRTRHVPSYESFGRTPTRAASTSATSYRQPPSRDFTRPRTLSVASVRTDSIYCAQTGVTPPPLLDMTSTPQQPWRDRNTQGIRSPIGRPVGFPENSIHQWNTQSPSLSRSQSVAVRPVNGVSALERRTSSATAPVGPTWNEAAQSEPKRRGTLRRC
ncbi:Ff.00g078970.m01.CDS01 [Fusarium sp. VM40]|nr:Ff.00g078970.m01.CDS01 [Fusarium sp. VM40]